MSEMPPRHHSRQALPSSPDETSLSGGTASKLDARVVDAWVAWLGALATDAEAALAAAMAYKELDAAARENWLGALEHDAERVSVPRIAVYAPLLAVESDPERRSRIIQAIGPADAAATPRVAASGLIGMARDGMRVATIVSPLYLDFVQVLACGYRVASGFEWVKHDPIVDRRKAPCPGDSVSGVVVEATPLKSLVDELAHAVVAHTRSGRSLPEALKVFADLFGPSASGSSPPPAP